MKKVLFVIDSLHCGGAEKSLLSLLSVLDASKYEKHLWILHPGGVLDKSVPVDVTIEEQPNYTMLQRLALRLGLGLYSYRRRHNKKNRHQAELLWISCGRFLKGLDTSFDIAVAYQQGLPTYMVATKIHAKMKIAWINTDIKSAGYDIMYNDPFYNKMRYIVCVSDLLESIVQNNMPQFADRIRCVYDIVSPEVVREMASKPVRELKDKPPGRIVLTTVARMVHLKNYPLAVEAASLLRQWGLDFVWFFVGGGTQLGQIRELIRESQLSDCVHAIGFKSNPYPYINSCDIYVQTSLHEGFGLTIAEAKILGKPIVSTDFDVVHDQLEDGVNGLITPMDPQALAECVFTLANDIALRQRLTAALKDSVGCNAGTEIAKVEQFFQS